MRKLSLSKRYALIMDSVLWFTTQGLFNLKRGTHYLNKEFTLKKIGTFYTFRETILPQKNNCTESVILVVGFRLKLIKSNPLLHWLFQQVCILTTLFWSGLKGFGIKLWMVDQTTKNYLGIYEWYGKENSEDYVTILLPILKLFSVKNSIFYELIPNKSLDQYLITYTDRSDHLLSAT